MRWRYQHAIPDLPSCLMVSTGGGSRLGAGCSDRAACSRWGTRLVVLLPPCWVRARYFSGAWVGAAASKSFRQIITIIVIINILVITQHTLA